ncbi:MAG: hypothetical protein V4689_02490 [Verrucomicrobiota bacterium]
MSRTISNTLSACLIGAGACVWAFAGRPLVTKPELNTPLNPLGINGSPYGEVFAMAMQGPIDTYFHGTAGSDHPHEHEGKAADHKTAAGTNTSGSAGNRFENLLASLENVSEIRTNPKAATESHKRYIRRQVEDKLRFAYQLDPSHYANYNSLHLFLTEPQLGTRPELTPSAAKLAEETIKYCLKQEHDPRPALTAAAAATNILELMFNNYRGKNPTFTVPQMKQYLALLDHCMGRYAAIAQEWDRTKNWELLSPQRITECDERFTFICRIREAAVKTIAGFEGGFRDSQASN